MTAAKRKRLGRGLGALLGEDYLQPSEGVEVRSLPVMAISPNPFQPRREFNEEELGDLRRSIRENGLLQPLVVRPTAEGDGRYELVAGERRLRCIAELGWKEVPAVVRAVDDRTLLVLALVENIQREALNPIEEAEGFRVLGEEFELTQAEIAAAVGRSRPAVANSLRLLRLPPSVRRMLEDGTLSMGHVRALLGVEDPARQGELARRAATEGWTVRQMEARTRGARRAEPPTRPRPEGRASDPVAGALQEELRRALGTRAVLRVDKNGAGAIEIPFRSVEDFERLFEIITGRDASDVAG